jgi:hypothetical protein
MAKIVGIHGIAQEYGGRFSLEKEWLPAVRDGLAAAEHDRLAESLTDKDLRVVFYGQMFRPPGTMGTGDYRYAPDDLRQGLELDLLTELYDAAFPADEKSGREQESTGRMGVVRVTVQIMVERLLRTETLAGIAEHAFVGALKQVALFLSDKATKEIVLENVRKAVRDDTRVLVGHSMGSIVAYEYLCRHRPSNVRMLITLGSPLGIRNLIFDRLTPPPVAGVGVWPGGVSAWVNVADSNDFVALRKKLSELWGNPASGSVITDRQAHNGNKPHYAVRYLNSRQTGAALGDVLG